MILTGPKHKVIIKEQLMKYFSLLFLISALCATPVMAQSNKIEKLTLASQEQKRTYYLFIPDSIKSMVPAPMIILLHGSGRDGMSLIEKWKDLAAKEGIILAAPNSQNSVGWAIPTDGPDFLHDVIEEIKSKYSVNPRRVYLFGHSAGGGFAIRVALHESEYFAATAIHAGALGERDRAVLNLGRRKIPFSIYVGTNDALFPLNIVRATRDALSARGFPVQLTEIPKHNHSYYDRASEINRQVWDFLKQHELSEDPKYIRYQFNK